MNGQLNTWSLFVFPRDSRQSWNEKTESDRTAKRFLSLIRPNGEFNQRWPQRVTAEKPLAEKCRKLWDK